MKRRHVGTSIQAAWSDSLASVRLALDTDPSADRETPARQRPGDRPDRDGVMDAVTTRLDLQRKFASRLTVSRNGTRRTSFGVGLCAGGDATQPDLPPLNRPT